MFAWLAQWLVRGLWRRSARLCLWLPTPRAALWAGVAAALTYALFSGWGVPAQRTVWMLTTLALLRQMGVRWPWPLAMLTAAFVVTVADPLAVGQAGFWLSFVAVSLLMASDSGSQPGWRGWIKEGLRSQLIASLGLAPLSLLFFGQISLVGLLANAVAVPLVTFIITPLAMLGMLLPLLWTVAAWCVQALFAYLHLLDALSHSVWFVPVAPVWAQVAGLCGSVLLVARLPWRLRLCGLALMLPLLWPAPWRPVIGQFDLIAADIGQGTAVLIRTSRHNVLFDTGPQYMPNTPGADAGERVLLPLMRALGVEQLDLMMLSHRDSDHVGGAASVIAGLPVKRLSSSLEDSHPLLREPVPHQRCLAGQHWDWDGVHFEVLHPFESSYAKHLKSNAMSCLLRVVAANGRSALMTGDIEAPEEKQVVAASVPGALRADLLMVPHHGSNTSSTDALLSAVAPALAVVQAGYRNKFGHPTIKVLARYQAHGVIVVDSPDCGALRWRSDASAWTCQRAEVRRYWAFVPASAPAPEALGPWPDEPSD